jgi:hypothetical protein
VGTLEDFTSQPTEKAQQKLSSDVRMDEIEDEAVEE